MVEAWIETRYDDPYQGVEREPGFENLWFGLIPGTYDRRRDTVVVCSYTIEESTRTVRCNDITTLGYPM